MEVIESTGLKCDNPACDWKDTTIPVEEMESWINRECPKCGENVLTQEDYNNALMAISIATHIGKMSEEELSELTKFINTDAVKEKMKQDGVIGVEHLEGDGIVSAYIDAHNGIRITEIKPES